MLNWMALTRCKIVQKNREKNTTLAVVRVSRDLTQTGAAAVNKQIFIQKKSRPNEFSRPLT